MNAEANGAEGWGIRINGALQAHFKQENGPSKPGIDYALILQKGAEEHRLMVRAYLADDMPPAAAEDTGYLNQTVAGYVFDRLNAGWMPADGPLPPMTILKPGPDYVPPAPPPRTPSLWQRIVERLF